MTNSRNHVNWAKTSSQEARSSFGNSSCGWEVVTGVAVRASWRSLGRRLESGVRGGSASHCRCGRSRTTTTAWWAARHPSTGLLEASLMKRHLQFITFPSKVPRFSSDVLPSLHYLFIIQSLTIHVYLCTVCIMVMEFRVWSLEFGIWNLELGTWNFKDLA
ncbi:hypothetical protein M434DRAFT_122883 [Hypoxylon sp. CO27-5]|nr:hypothetical protein M434DRAFT_122883 [Hypoxylon sp. CO27-5]